MDMKTTAGLLAALPFLLGGCETVETAEVEEKPMAEVSRAVLTQKTAQAHQELEATVSKALGGKKVSLATEVLMGESTLAVQQKEVMGPDGNPIMGRIMTKPDVFILKTDGETCSLTHEESGEVYPLSSVICERASS